MKLYRWAARTPLIFKGEMFFLKEIKQFRGIFAIGNYDEMEITSVEIVDFKLICHSSVTLQNLIDQFVKQIDNCSTLPNNGPGHFFCFFA